MPRTRLIAIALIALIAAINLYSLEPYPMPHADEAIYAEIGYGFYERGTFSTDLYGAQYGLDYNHINSGRIYHLLEGAALRLHRSLLIARLISYLGWLVGILGCYLAGRSLYDDERVGLVSAVAFATSMRALFSSHFARPEIWVAAWAAISLWLMAITLQRPTPVRLLALGFIAVPGLAFHPMGIWFAGAVGLIMLVELTRTRQWRNLALFLLASLIATAIFALLHLLPDPARTLRYLSDSSWFYGDRTPLSGTFATRLANLGDFFSSAYLLQLNYTVIPFTLYFIAATITLLITRRRPDRLLLAFTFASLIAFVIGLQYRSRYYGVLWDSPMALIIGAALTYLTDHFKPRLPNWKLVTGNWQLLSILPLVIVAAGIWGYLSLKFHPRDFNSYQAALHDHIPPNTRVLADTALWWTFGERNDFVSDWQFYDWVNSDQATMGEVITRYTIEYIVDDQTTVADDSGTPQTEALTAYLAASCEVVATIEDRWFGRGGQIGQGVPTVIYHCTP